MVNIAEAFDLKTGFDFGVWGGQDIAQVNEN